MEHISKWLPKKEVPFPEVDEELNNAFKELNEVLEELKKHVQESQKLAVEALTKMQTLLQSSHLGPTLNMLKDEPTLEGFGNRNSLKRYQK